MPYRELRLLKKKFSVLFCPMQNIEYYDIKYKEYILLTEEEKKLLLTG